MSNLSADRRPQTARLRQGFGGQADLPIMGSYGEGNLGDEAILNGILSLIAQVNPQLTPVVFSHDEAHSKATHHLETLPPLPAGLRSWLRSLSSFRFKKVVQVLRRAPIVLIGGGGIFYSHSFSRGRNPLIVWRHRTRILRHLRVPYATLCVGVSQPENDFDRACLLEIFQGAKAISVRDEVSKEILLSAGVSKEIAVLPDPGWFAVFAPLTRGVGGLFNLRNKRPRLGISLREWYLYDKEKFTQYKKFCTDLLHWARQHYEVTLIPMSLGNDHDGKWFHDIGGTEGEISNIHTLDQAIELIGSQDKMISMRLHSLIFAVRQQIPTLALAYNSKVETIAESSKVPFLTPDEWSIPAIHTHLESLRHHHIDLPSDKGILEFLRTFLA